MSRLSTQFSQGGSCSRRFGFYYCHDCGNEWRSAYTWCVGSSYNPAHAQNCKSCDQSIIAHDVTKLRRKKKSYIDPSKQHVQELCHRCRDKPLPCRGYRRSRSRMQRTPPRSPPRTPPRSPPLYGSPHRVDFINHYDSDNCDPRRLFRDQKSPTPPTTLQSPGIASPYEEVDRCRNKPYPCPDSSMHIPLRYQSKRLHPMRTPPSTPPMSLPRSPPRTPSLYGNPRRVGFINHYDIGNVDLPDLPRNEEIVLSPVCNERQGEISEQLTCSLQLQPQSPVPMLAVPSFSKKENDAAAVSPLYNEQADKKSVECKHLSIIQSPVIIRSENNRKRSWTQTESQSMNGIGCNISKALSTNNEKSWSETTEIDGEYQYGRSHQGNSKGTRMDF